MRMRPSGESGPPLAMIVRRLLRFGRWRFLWNAASARVCAGERATVAVASAAIARSLAGIVAGARMTVGPRSSAASQGHAALPTTRRRSSGRRSACSSRSARGRNNIWGGQSRVSGATISAGSGLVLPSITVPGFGLRVNHAVHALTDCPNIMAAQDNAFTIVVPLYEDLLLPATGRKPQRPCGQPGECRDRLSERFPMADGPMLQCRPVW